MRSEAQPKTETPFHAEFDHPLKIALDRNWMKVAASLTLAGFIATTGVAFLTGHLLEQGDALTWASGTITVGFGIFTAWMGYIIPFSTLINFLLKIQ